MSRVNHDARPANAGLKMPAPISIKADTINENLEKISLSAFKRNVSEIQSMVKGANDYNAYLRDFDSKNYSSPRVYSDKNPISEKAFDLIKANDALAYLVVEPKSGRVYSSDTQLETARKKGVLDEKDPGKLLEVAGNQLSLANAIGGAAKDQFMSNSRTRIEVANENERKERQAAIDAERKDNIRLAQNLDSARRKAGGLPANHHSDRFRKSVEDEFGIKNGRIKRDNVASQPVAMASISPQESYNYRPTKSNELPSYQVIGAKTPQQVKYEEYMNRSSKGRKSNSEAPKQRADTADIRNFDKPWKKSEQLVAAVNTYSRENKLSPVMRMSRSDLKNELYNNKKALDTANTVEARNKLSEKQNKLETRFQMWIDAKAELARVNQEESGKLGSKRNKGTMAFAAKINPEEVPAGVNHEFFARTDKSLRPTFLTIQLGDDSRSARTTKIPAMEVGDVVRLEHGVFIKRISSEASADNAQYELIYTKPGNFKINGAAGKGRDNTETIRTFNREIKKEEIDQSKVPFPIDDVQTT